LDNRYVGVAGSTSVVLAALVANGAIAVLNFGAFLFVGPADILRLPP
jgi:hypothetical protein